MNEDAIFRNAIKDGNLQQLKNIPKADVHNHSLLGMRFETFNAKFGGKVMPPAKQIDGLQELDNYIFKELLKHIDSTNQLDYLLDSTLLEAIDGGVVLLEASVDMGWILIFKNIESALLLIQEKQNKYTDFIDFRPELGIAKNISNDLLNREVIECIESGVFQSVDLYGDELIQDFERYKTIYEFARSKGLKLKVHIGEFSDANSVRRAVEVLNVDEIQHGINIYTDEYVIDMVKERGIRLNVCPTSNVVLGAVHDIKNHPIKELFEKGVKLSINTDDLLVFNKGVSEEYLNLYQNAVLGADELNEIRKMALNR